VSDSDKPHHIFVCTSCRPASSAREPRSERAGAQLYESLVDSHDVWAKRSGFVILPYECLSACTRPCVVALKAPDKYTYVFGDLQPHHSEGSLIECAGLYRASPSGFMQREARPKLLRNGILARVPPLGMSDE
jgi:predicted metal-binding protein